MSSSIQRKFRSCFLATSESAASALINIVAKRFQLEWGTREVVLGRVLGCNQKRIQDVVTVHWKFGHEMHRSQLDGDGYHE